MPRHVAVRVLELWRDPELVFRAVAGADAPAAVWLDGGADAVDGRSVIAVAHAASPLLLAGADADTEAVLDELRATLAAASAAFGPGDPALAADRTALGWLGWFGYEFGARRQGVPVATAETPEAAWLFADRAIVFDHARRAVRLEWLDSAEGDEWSRRTGDLIAGLGEVSDADTPAGEASTGETSGGEASTLPPAPAAPRWRHDPTAYADLIAACQAAIARGDAYQLCLTNRVDVEVRPDPFETYVRLRRSSPTHHGGYLRFGEVALLSASPEQFLQVERDGRVATRPMKGTRPRGATPEQDEVLRRELLASDKERAENLMIVDLMRNDLARVAELGSVRVPDLLVTETYPHVHQLVSTVSARLAAGRTAVDAIAAAFPAGSMTGAPKLSAMRILHALEAGPRGVYSGVFGSLAVDGSADLAMVIRSIVLAPGGASVGTGGGITALSIAEDEIDETRIKARALLAVLTGEAGTPIQ